MKILVSYAHFDRATIHDEPQLVIRDTVQNVERLDEFAVNSIRENLRKQTGYSVSIIAITKLDEL